MKKIYIFLFGILNVPVSKHSNTAVLLTTEHIEPRYGCCLRVLPQAQLHSRQMEESISTACSIAFIKQHTKDSLRVSYFIGKRKLSREWYWDRFCIYLKKTIQTNVSSLSWTILSISENIYFELMLMLSLDYIYIF